MIRRSVFTLILSLGIAVTVAAESPARDIIDVALEDIGAGRAEEVRSRILNTPLTVLGPEFRARAVEALPEQVRGHRITHGNLLRRVQRVMGPVLRLHGREGDIEVVLFRNRIPQAMLWRGCVMLLSDGLAEPLPDAELAGIVAHEISHPYFMDEMVGAQRAKDETRMRVVELKCDASAVLTVKLLGLDPASYLKGIKRMKEITRRMSLSGGLEQTHPQMHERAQFIGRFQKLLVSVR
jgi:Zn-dependent protease with chaperone function